MTDTSFLLVQRHGQIGTLHIDHPWEQCNTDDADVKVLVGTKTAAMMLADREARACAYCEPTPDPQVLNTRGDAP